MEKYRIAVDGQYLESTIGTDPIRMIFCLTPHIENAGEYAFSTAVKHMRSMHKQGYIKVSLKLLAPCIDLTDRYSNNR